MVCILLLLFAEFSSIFCRKKALVCILLPASAMFQLCFHTANPNPQFLGELILAELSSASESIQLGLINLGRSEFEFDSAREVRHLNRA